MKVYKLSLLILLLFTVPQVQAEDTAPLLSEGDWFLTSDFGNITLTNLIDYSDLDNQDRKVFAHLVSTENETFTYSESYELIDQETGWLIGKEFNTSYKDLFYAMFDEDPRDNKPFDREVEEITRIQRLGFQAGINGTQDIEYQHYASMNWVAYTPAMDFVGWNNLSRHTTYNEKLIDNGTSTLVINGYPLTVHTYTLMRDEYSLRGTSYIANYFNETAYISKLDTYNDTGVFHNTTYVNNGVAYDTSLSSAPWEDDEKWSRINIYRYALDIHFPVQVFFDDLTLDSKRNIQEFSVKNYVPKVIDMDDDKDKYTETITEYTDEGRLALPIFGSLLAIPVLLKRFRN